ncbi:MAG: hypothetical protein IJ981_03230 [Clostridia bacterium]|nr:hypothetical protein [Clostridia bacterium]
MKEKQIEEMAKIMCGNDCEECAKETSFLRGISLEKAKAEKCLLKNCAKTLYEQGYRKIPDGAVVLTKEEYKQIYNDERASYYRAENLFIENDLLNRKLVQARKETAREVIKRFISQIEFHGIATMDGDLEYFKISGLGLREIAREQFGVEVEE